MEWITEHPTEYLTLMVQECTKLKGLSLNPIVSLIRRLDLLEVINFDFLVVSINFDEVWI